MKNSDTKTIIEAMEAFADKQQKFNRRGERLLAESERLDKRYSNLSECRGTVYDFMEWKVDHERHKKKVLGYKRAAEKMDAEVSKYNQLTEVVRTATESFYNIKLSARGWQPYRNE